MVRCLIYINKNILNKRRNNMEISMDIPYRIYNEAKKVSAKELARKFKLPYRKAEFYKRMVKNGSPVAFHSSNNGGKIVGVIGDLHAPFLHEHYLDFLIDTFTSQGVTKLRYVLATII